jgi:hypothetical protein
MPPPLVRLSRPNYFSGRLLNAEDLARDQQYQLDSRRRHNQLLHGAGVLYGLELTVAGAADSQVRVQPGVALDCLGREVVVVEALETPLPAGRVLYASVHYIERLVDAAPVLGEQGAEGATQASRVEEDAEVVLEIQDPIAAHPSRRAFLRACGLDHAIPIGRLRFSDGKWRADHAYKPPRVAHHRAPASGW